MIAPGMPRYLLFGGVLAALVAATALMARGSNERVIPMTAMRFEFTPSTVTLKRGEPVIFELTSLDRPHGFNIPELNLRADVLPDETVRVRVIPQKAGRYG